MQETSDDSLTLKQLRARLVKKFKWLDAKLQTLQDDEVKLFKAVDSYHKIGKLILDIDKVEMGIDSNNDEHEDITSMIKKWKVEKGSSKDNLQTIKDEAEKALKEQDASPK